MPLHNIEVRVQRKEEVTGVTLVPQEAELSYCVHEGELKYNVPVVDCHRMVLIKYRQSVRELL